MGKLKYTGDLLADLILDDWETFHAKHPEINKNTWKGKRNYHRKRLKEGKVPMEQLPQQNSEETVSRVAELLERSGIDPNDIQRVNRVNVYQGYMKGEDGKFVTRDLYSVQYVPKGKELSEDLVIRQVPPVNIRPARTTRARSKDLTAFIVPDLQGGFRRHTDGTLEPIHDEQVVSVGLQIIRDLQPDQIILNGDNLDFPDLSSFKPDSEHFQAVMQATLDRVYEILATMRASAPDARIVWLEGNHENRLRKQILNHNMNLWGVRRPGNPDDYPFLSIPHLMNLACIDVEYVSGYPANTYQLNDRLQAIHGHKVRSGGSTAAMYASEEELSTIFGHVHRMEVHSRTNRLGRAITAMSFGTWARIDGAVPSYGNGVDDEGQVVKRYENWQNGAGVIEYQAGDHPFQIHPIHIDHQENYETRFNGKIYKPNE